jgi:carbamoyltransferase
MRILGISETDNDAGAALLHDGEVVCAINEERLSRIKRHVGFPRASVAWILEYAGLSLDQVDCIAIAKADPHLQPDRFDRPWRLLRAHRYFGPGQRVGRATQALNLLVNRCRNVPRMRSLARRMSAEIREWCRDHRCEEKTIRVPHHLAHAASAYWASGFDTALAVTLDGQGEGVTSQVYVVRQGKFELIHEVLLPDSLGNFYAAVTKALGFKPNQHEGKVSGLAAYAEPPPDLLACVRRLAWIDAPGNFRAGAVYGAYPRIMSWARRHGPVATAAAFQRVLEEVVGEYVGHYARKLGIGDVVLAGGVTANVRVNQRIHETPGVERVFIFPHMADGGLAHGAAQIAYRDQTGDLTRRPIEDVYWGPSYDDARIEAAIQRQGLPYRRMTDVPGEVADLLTQRQVIGHFDGRMEYGPRALGNRSILYAPTDPAVNDWLNAQLHRTEFMPFAPVTLREHAGDCYLGLAGAELASHFMTITFDCTPRMREQAPACVHVDGTARPQIIDRAINPRYYDIVAAYHRRTGIPTLINTSFNMHEEPIVCTPEDALRAFVAARLHALAIGSFLVTQASQSA